MALGEITTARDGPAFLIAAATMYEAIAANCSSPQTAELNANARAATLMKWVHIGLVQGVGLVVLAAIIDPPHAKPLLAGGAITGSIMYALYMHAAASGLASSEPPTEDWSNQQQAA